LCKLNAFSSFRSWEEKVHLDSVGYIKEGYSVCHLEKEDGKEEFYGLGQCPCERDWRGGEDGEE